MLNYSYRDNIIVLKRKEGKTNMNEKAHQLSLAVKHVENVAFEIMGAVSRKNALTNFLLSKDLKIDNDGEIECYISATWNDGYDYVSRVIAILNYKDGDMSASLDNIKVDLNEGITPCVVLMIKEMKNINKTNGVSVSHKENSKEVEFIQEAILLAIEKLKEHDKAQVGYYNPKITETTNKGLVFETINDDLNLLIKGKGYNVNFNRRLPINKGSYKIVIKANIEGKSGKGDTTTIRNFTLRDIIKETDRTRALNEYAYLLYQEVIYLIKNL